MPFFRPARTTCPSGPHSVTEPAMPGHEETRRRPIPPRLVLSLLLVLAVVPPFVSQASGSVVGAYTMFHRMVRYHLELGVLEGGRERSVPVRSLAPHLSRTARPILLPAEGYAIGADQVDVVAN